MDSSPTPAASTPPATVSDPAPPPESVTHCASTRKRSFLRVQSNDGSCRVSLSHDDNKDIVQAWCTELDVTSLDKVASLMEEKYPGGISLFHSSRGSNIVLIPDQVRPYITKLSTSTHDGRTVCLQDLDSPLPRLHSLDLGDGLIMPRQNEVDMPAEFAGEPNLVTRYLRGEDLRRHAASMVIEVLPDGDDETHPEQGPPPSKLPYSTIGRTMFPSLRNVSMKTYQSYGLDAAIPTLGTLSHIDGKLSLFIRDPCDSLIAAVESMQRHLRFPRVKTLRLRFWEGVHGAQYNELVHSGPIWANVEALLLGLFGHPDQVWPALESLELDLIHEVPSSESLQHCLSSVFPHLAWNTVLQRSPNLRSIVPWPMSNRGPRCRADVTPFLYAMYVAPRFSHNAPKRWLNAESWPALSSPSLSLASSSTPSSSDADEATVKVAKDLLCQDRRNCFPVNLLTLAHLLVKPSLLRFISFCGLPRFADLHVSTDPEWLTVLEDPDDAMHLDRFAAALTGDNDDTLTLHVTLTGDSDSCLEVSQRLVPFLQGLLDHQYPKPRLSVNVDTQRKTGNIAQQLIDMWKHLEQPSNAETASS